MGRRHFRPEQIIHMLREAEIKLAGGKTTGEVCRVLGRPRSTQRRTLATAIGASPRFSAFKAGTSTTSVWSASGVARG